MPIYSIVQTVVKVHRPAGGIYILVLFNVKTEKSSNIQRFGRTKIHISSPYRCPEVCV